MGVKGCLPKEPRAHRCMGLRWGCLEYYELVPMSAGAGLVRATPIVLSHTHPQGSRVDARSISLLDVVSLGSGALDLSWVRV